MTRRTAVAALSAASLAEAQTKKAAMINRFVGVWRLVSYESKDKVSGEVLHPYGANPVGRIAYDAAGRMSAQLMRPGRRAIGGSSTRGSASAVRDASPDDMREILSGFTAYFGTFDIDESSRTVIHHVEAHLIPGWVGADLRRSYEFSGADRLILTASLDQSVNRLVWQRDGK